MNDDLLQLATDLADIKELLLEASRKALRCYENTCTHDPVEGRAIGDGWPAMGRLADELDALLSLASELPGAEVADAIRAEREELDYLSDMADAQSY